MIKNRCILIVDDDVELRELVGFYLRKEGYQHMVAFDQASTFDAISRQKPDLIILDWMLPGGSGLDIAERLKHTPALQEIPIIMLTGKAEEKNRVKGLNMGADDYVIKPFAAKELLARIRAVLRRSTAEDAAGLITLGNFVVDTGAETIVVNDEIIKLTHTEFRLLHFFVTHRDRIFSRSEIIDYVWGNQSTIDERTIDVQIRRLRNVLNQHKLTAMIYTIRGSGYRFSLQ